MIPTNARQYYQQAVLVLRMIKGMALSPDGWRQDEVVFAGVGYALDLWSQGHQEHLLALKGKEAPLPAEGEKE